MSYPRTTGDNFANKTGHLSDGDLIGIKQYKGTQIIYVSLFIWSDYGDHGSGI